MKTYIQTNNRNAGAWRSRLAEIRMNASFKLRQDVYRGLVAECEKAGIPVNERVGSLVEKGTMALPHDKGGWEHAAIEHIVDWRTFERLKELAWKHSIPIRDLIEEYFSRNCKQYHGIVIVDRDQLEFGF